MAFKDLFKVKSKDNEVKEERIDNQSLQFNFDEEEKRKIVDLVCHMVDECKLQRQEWLDIRKESIRMYEGVREPKSVPWANCSNISTMVTMTACDLMHSKLFPIVWNDDLIYWKGTEKNDVERATKVREFMRYVVQQHMKMQNDVDDICHSLVVDGTVIIKVVWKPYYKKVQRRVPKGVGEDITFEIVYEQKRFERCFLELVPVERCYFPVVGNECSEDEYEYIVHELFYTPPQLKELEIRGFIKNADTVKEGLATYLALQEGTQLERLNSQGLTEFLTRRDAYPAKVYDAYIKYDWNGDGIQEQCVFQVAPETKTYLSGKPLTAVSKIEERPWVIGQFLRRPGSRLGKGIPEIMRHLHKEMDAIHNQRIDAGNIVIAPWFFFKPSSGLKTEEIRVGPGVGVPLDDPQRDVSFPQISTNGLTVSFQEEKIVLDLIERLTSVSAYQLGKESDVVKSRATARGTLAIIQQGEQKFTILGKRTQAILARMLNKVLHKYQQYFPPELQERVMGSEDIPFPNIAPEDIIGNFDSYMVLDAAAGSAAMEREANMAMYQTMINDPYVTQNPTAGWEIRAEYIRALGKRDVEKFIGPRPPTQELEKAPHEENMRMAHGEQVHPKEGENHVQHLVTHVQFKSEKEYQDILPEYKGFVDAHIAETKELYERQMLMGGLNAEQTQGAEQGGPPQGTTGAPGMGGISGPHVPGHGGAQGLQAPGPGGGMPTGTPGQPTASDVQPR